MCIRDSSSIVLGVPMNEIKIDMSFIKGILNNEKQQMLVKNIVNFARSTNMNSCIEDVYKRQSGFKGAASGR